MNVCKDEIKNAIEHELVAANEVHPPFASLHEAYAVILEEFDEAEEQMQLCKEEMGELWRTVKSDHLKGSLESLHWIQVYAQKSAEECCQLAAMAIKAQQSEIERMEGGE